MRVEKTKLDSVVTVHLDEFEDHRGTYVELYNKEFYNNAGINIDFVQDDISTSTKGVLRGLHGDEETYKLVSCLKGKFYLVVVNNDPESKQYKQWQAFTLSEKNRMQVLIPPKFGNGHLILSDYAIFHYKQNTYYNPRGQFTIKWNDPKFDFWWPIKEPILSMRDELGHYVN